MRSGPFGHFLKAIKKYLGVVGVEGTSSTPARGMADSQRPVAHQPRSPESMDWKQGVQS